jgi:hypothetical protein
MIRDALVRSGSVFDDFGKTEDRTIGPVRSWARVRTGPVKDQDHSPVWSKTGLDWS